MRFEKTGTYRLYISSSRVTIGKFYGKDIKYMEGISNIVEFEIVPPDKVWQQKKLAESINILDSMWQEKELRGACETLRYLGTEAAAAEMVRRSTGLEGKDKTCTFDFSMGLHGSPHRKFIINEMERKMSDPEFPVSPTFFRDLSLLSFFLHNPQKFPAWGDEGAQAEINKLQKLREDEVIRIARLLAVAVKNKKPAAYLTSAYTLFSFRASVDRTPADGIVIDDTLITAFSNLPAEKQNTVLIYYWDQFKMPKMLPILRNIYARLEGPGQADQNLELRGSVLQRIYELAPAEGRNLIMAEIRRPETRVKDETLTLLTDKEIPEIEGLLLKRATGPGEADARRGLFLLERYGTPKASKVLQAAYKDRIGNMECALQQSLINYFLKHEPEEGSKMVGAALDVRKQTECYKTVFEDFNPKYWSKAVEEVTVSYLNDENIGIVKEIVEALERFASADVKERLWQRLEKLSAFPENDIAAKTKGYGSRSQPSNTLEMTLVSALAHSPSWKLTEAEFSKLAGLCVTKECREWVGALLPKSDQKTVR